MSEERCVEESVEVNVEVSVEGRVLFSGVDLTAVADVRVAEDGVALLGLLLCMYSMY